MRKLNLLPQEISHNMLKRKRRLVLVLIICLLLITSLCGLIFIDSRKNRLKNEVSSLLQDLTAIKVKIKDKSKYEDILRDFETRQAVYTDLTKNKIKYSQVLNKIILLIPEEIILDTLKVDSVDYIKIYGFAPKLGDIARIMEDIKKINGVIDITLGFTHFIEVGTKANSHYHFEIVVELQEG